MVPIEYVHGDATTPQARPAVIAHICNDVGLWGRGFVKAISARWPQPEHAYRTWFANGSGCALEAVQMVRVETGLWVANMIAQRSIRGRTAGPPIRYDALEVCLTKTQLAAEGVGASIHMPRIGCGLAGGTWDRIEPIIVRTVSDFDIPVTVYDPPPAS